MKPTKKPKSTVRPDTLGKLYIEQIGNSPNEIKDAKAEKTIQELSRQSDELTKESRRIVRLYSSCYIRGTRGGCYYLTGSGRKQYVVRSLCKQIDPPALLSGFYLYYL